MLFVKPLRKEYTDLVNKVASIVLAGGQGTRLHPLTLHRCKPAVSFGGRYRLIDIPISNSLNSHIQRIYVISQYFAASLQQHLTATYHYDSFQNGNLEMLCPEETTQGKEWFKGTADAVRKNWDNLSKAPVDYFLILSGDQLYNMDFSEMIQFAKEQDSDLMIASIPVKEAEAKRMGLLKIDASHQIQEFVEKPTDPKVLQKFALTPDFYKKRKQKEPKETTYLGSMGIYVFKKEVLHKLLESGGNDFGKEIIPLKVKEGKTSAFIYDGYWEDIGTISSYYLANLALTDQKECLNTHDEEHPIYTRPFNLPSPIITDTLVSHSLISQGSVIEAKEIHHSVLGIRTKVHKGTIIRDSIILGNDVYPSPVPGDMSCIDYYSIGENCIIEKAIIDEQTRIGNNVQLTNKKQLTHYDGNGIYIRDGIIVVTSGTAIPDGFTL